MDDLDLISTSWINDLSCCFDFWVEEPDWVDDPNFEGDTFFEDGSCRASLNPLPRPLPPRKEGMLALGSMIVRIHG